MTNSPENHDAAPGPVLFVYDGTPAAAYAITRASQEIVKDRDALVVCVWQPADVGFEPVGHRHFDADSAHEVCRAAQETADYGAQIAREAGFEARGVVEEAAPTWKGVIHAATQHGASLIVVGDHRHSGLVGHLLSGVSSSVVSHAPCPVMVIHS